MSGMWMGKEGVEFGVELCPAEDAERDDIEPEEQGDAGAERAVDLRVVGKTRDIPAKDERGGKPHGGGDDGAGNDALPGLLHGRSHVVDQGDDADAAGERDDPADEQSDGVEGSASRGDEVQREPAGKELAEHDEGGGKKKRQQRDRNKEEGAETALPEGPAVEGKFVGAADAFHQGGEDAGGSDETDDEGGDEGVRGPWAVGCVDEVAFEERADVGRKDAVEEQRELEAERGGV